MFTSLKQSLFVALACALPFCSNGQSATETQPSPDEAAVAQSAVANRPTYNAATQTMTMADGTQIPLSEMAPGSTPAIANKLMTVNRYNMAAEAQNAQAEQASSTNVDGQAYRSMTSVAVKTQAYAAPVKSSATGGLGVPQATPDPHGSPGVIGFTPNVYFVGQKPFVIVGVTLTGGYGPASVAYRVTGASIPSNTFGNVQGELTWGAGEIGTKTFTIPVNVIALVKQGVSAGEIDMDLTDGMGAQLAGAESGRVIFTSAKAGLGATVPPCGSSGGLPCFGSGLPSTATSPPAPSLTPPANSNLGRGSTGLTPCDTGAGPRC